MEFWVVNLGVTGFMAIIAINAAVHDRWVGMIVCSFALAVNLMSVGMHFVRLAP